MSKAAYKNETKIKTGKGKGSIRTKEREEGRGEKRLRKK